MADKQTNVKVVWQVDTQQLERSKNLTQQAQQAADKYHQSATQGAKSSSAELNKLTAEQTRLTTAIQNTNRSSFSSYQAYVKQLQNLSRQYSDVKVKIDAATKSINEQNKAIKEQATQTKGLATNFSNLYNTIRTVIAAGILREVVNTSLEMAKLAGNVEGVEKAFARLPNSVLLLDSLRRATHGTVNDLELMQKALQANNFRIPLEQLGVLLEFAAVKAQQTGQEVNHLVDYIVSGIGYRSIKRLDDLGFTANRVRDALGGVSLQAASMAQVMNAITTLMNEDLQKTGGFAETSATKVGELTTAWHELRVEVAKKITQDGGFVDFLNDAVEAMRLLVKGGGDIAKALRMEGIDKEAIELVKLFREGLGTDSAKNIEDVQQKLNSLVQDIGRYNDLIAETQRTIDKGNGFGFPGFSKENQEGAKRYAELVEIYGNRAKAIFEREISQARALLSAQLRNREVLSSMIPILKQFMDSLTGVDEAADAMGLIAAKMEQIEGVSDAIKAAKSTGEIHDLNNELDKLNGQLADLKAFGTTKQFLQVNGQLKLVPVVAPKNAGRVSEIGTPEATKQLEAEVQAMLDEMRLTIPPLAAPAEGIIPMDEWERIGQAFAENWTSIVDSGLSSVTALINVGLQAEADAYDQKLVEAREYYDHLAVLAGDDQKTKDRLRAREAREEKKLRREAFEADKDAQVASAAMSGAAGIVRAFATMDYYSALVAAALIAAETATQIAVIESQKPRFKDGVIDLKGPGTKTSDSISARLSRGESVMTADETSSSKGLLTQIREGQLNDKIFAKTLDENALKQFKLTGAGVTYNGMDDSRIVNELKNLRESQPDLAEKFGVLMKTKKNSENYKLWVRAKSF